MQKLYLDCDGVILDTISKSCKILRKEGIVSKDEVTKFYTYIDWSKLIEESGEINDSISKIKELSNYFDIEILTHVNSENESNVKRNYFAKELPNINVITVPIQVKKADFVDASGKILVDDSSSNLEYWIKKGGIGIKFSNSTQECNYRRITNLLELLDIFIKKEIKN